MMIKSIFGVVVLGIAMLAVSSSAQAQCPYSGGYSNYYAPSYGYSSNYYAPSYRYSGYAPSYG